MLFRRRGHSWILGSANDVIWKETRVRLVWDSLIPWWNDVELLLSGAEQDAECRRGKQGSTATRRCWNGRGTVPSKAQEPSSDRRLEISSGVEVYSPQHDWVDVKDITPWKEKEKRRSREWRGAHRTMVGVAATSAP